MKLVSKVILKIRKGFRSWHGMGVPAFRQNVTWIMFLEI